MLETIENFVSVVNGFAWGPPMLILLAGTGLFLTFGIKFMTWRNIGKGFKLFADPSSHKEDKATISPFKALMTAMSATVGTGNIVGVATAIVLGGPGAVFYMWLIALVGMATKYAEAVCAVTYHEKAKTGLFVGGPMYYLKNGVGKKFPITGSILAALFAFFGAFAAFGIGNGTQINSMSKNLVNAFGDFVPPLFVGIFFAVIIGYILFGGIKRIAKVAASLVPLMIVLYLLGAVVALFINYDRIPEAFGLIFYHAFTPSAAVGGFTGATIAAAMRFGVARGIFSNESGLGSAAIAHGSSNNTPYRQGVIAMMGTFIDTIIVCSMTALVILTSGAWTELNDAGTGGLDAAIVTGYAFDSAFLGGKYLVTAALLLFAFTTIIGWSYYGERCWQYLFRNTKGLTSLYVYRIAFILAIVFFSVQNTTFVWNVADTLNGLMALPNIIGLLILSPLVFKVTKDNMNKRM
ncbi:MAG: alanine/glycine:cation symporter family protein [Alphaproteobacteria bacterium]